MMCESGEYADQRTLLTRYHHYPEHCQPPNPLLPLALADRVPSSPAGRGVIDITPEMAEGAVSYESVLAALEYITFPQNCNRLNVKKDNDRTECQSTSRPFPADSDPGAGVLLAQTWSRSAPAGSSAGPSAPPTAGAAALLATAA